MVPKDNAITAMIALRLAGFRGSARHPEIIAECSLACLDHAASRTAKHRSRRTREQASLSAVIPQLVQAFASPDVQPATARNSGSATMRSSCRTFLGVSTVQAVGGHRWLPDIAQEALPGEAHKRAPTWNWARRCHPHSCLKPWMPERPTSRDSGTFRLGPSGNTEGTLLAWPWGMEHE